MCGTYPSAPAPSAESIFNAAFALQNDPATHAHLAQAVAHGAFAAYGAATCMP